MANKNDIVTEAEEILEEAEGKIEIEDGNEAKGAQEAPEADAAGKGEEVGQEPVEPAEPTLEEQLETAREAEQEWQDKFMRLHAEWDTYRRRTNEQRAQEKARATEDLVESLLPVIDDFERSIDYAQNNGEAGLLDGVKQVHAKLVEVLVKSGVEVIDPAGQPFDALEAQAVAKVDDDSVFDETVAEVYQKGYRMGSKVLRPATVTVTTGGPVRPKEDEDQAEAEEN